MKIKYSLTNKYIFTILAIHYLNIFMLTQNAIKFFVIKLFKIGLKQNFISVVNNLP